MGPVDRTAFRSYAVARLAVVIYMEGWYNLRSSRGYRSPVSFARRIALTRAA